MCGIVCIIHDCDAIACNVSIAECTKQIEHRGPDSSNYININSRVSFGFQRLAIIDPSDKSNQPLYLDNIVLICNGEIFNYHEIIQENGFQTRTDSDCEVIMHLYKKYGIHQTVDMLDAEFSFILYDNDKDLIYVARDAYGVRPLFLGMAGNSIILASEIKAMLPLNDNNIKIEPFLPGHYMEINVANRAINSYIKYFNIDILPSCYCDGYGYGQDGDGHGPIHSKINELFTSAVVKRLMSDRPIGCLLSGGLDSSLVTSIVSRYIPNLQCFSIGLDGGIDIIAAKKVVNFLKIPTANHHIVNFTVEEGLSAIRDVIYHLESYDITTIRASTPQYLLAKYIRTNTDIKVLYSGEGSDELFGGYQYSKLAPSDMDLHWDTVRLLNELYLYDNLRTDRTTAAWGLEVRIPFLDKKFTQYILDLDPSLKRSSMELMEKMLLRESFKNNSYLPDEILYRPKEAFSDAVSSKEVSWYKTLSTYIDIAVSDEEFALSSIKYPYNTPQTKEALYYRNIFTELYPIDNIDKIIPHYWLPKWQGDISDPSATVLKCYQG
jgi:asparagine synthase (glutamine-hydrolysing)